MRKREEQWADDSGATGLEAATTAVVGWFSKPLGWTVAGRRQEGEEQAAAVETEWEDSNRGSQT